MITKAQARAVVDAMPDLSQAKTETSRRRVVTKSKAAAAGQHYLQVKVDRAVVSDIDAVAAALRLSRAEVIGAACQRLRGDVGAGASGAGVQACARLVKITGVDAAEVIDFCVQFTLQELLRCRRVAIS